METVKRGNLLMNKVFTDIAWNHYLYWQMEDKRILKKINELIRDIERNWNTGLGKPEPLKHELSGYWSRRITDEHRLIYSIEDNKINVISCRNHYK
jgi:toxin YoeB